MMQTVSKALKIEGLEEGQIGAINEKYLIAVQTGNPEKLSEPLTNFVARRLNGGWEVEFTYSMYTGRQTKDVSIPGVKVLAKRGGIRRFSRITGVQAWMEKMGIPEFRAIL